MGRGMRGLLGDVGTSNLAGSVGGNVSLGSVSLGPRASSGKSLGEVYSDARDAGAKRVVDAIDRTNREYGGALAGRQIAGQTPLGLGSFSLPNSPASPAVVSTMGGGGGGGGSAKGKRGGRGRAGKADDPFFGDIEKDLTDLQRQIDLIGKSNEEVATAKARWELLDEAKKRGITVNDTLNAQIDAQAAQVGRLTAELERGEIAQQQFEDAVDGIADAMAGALVAGESLREGLAQVFKQIASDILSSGIRQAITSSFGNAGGGGGSFLGSLFGGFKMPSFDGGGFTGMGSRSGGIDGKGGFPGILHPNETVLDHTKGQSAGGGTVDVRVFMDDNGNWQEQAERISGKFAGKVVAANQQQQADKRYLRGK